MYRKTSKSVFVIFYNILLWKQFCNESVHLKKYQCIQYGLEKKHRDGKETEPK